MDRIPSKDRALLQTFEFRQKVRSIKVSTIDYEVRMQLRQFNQPICCFGEDEADRRERLRHLIAKSDGMLPLMMNMSKRQNQEAAPETSSADKSSDNVWYHHGSKELIDTRKWILKYTLNKLANRRNKIKTELSELTPTQCRAVVQEQHRKARSIHCIASNTCLGRPLSACQFAPILDNEPDKESILATGQWDGNIRLWNVPSLTENVTYSSAHSSRISSIVWNPQFNRQNCNIDLASADHDGIVKLWSINNEPVGEPIGVLDGLQPFRVGKMSFHPSGQFLVTPSYDKSWRLWDLTTGVEIQMQEGHTGAVTAAQWHPDGNLLVTSDSSGYGRVWDVRSGRCIMFLEGHAGSIICNEWTKCGSMLATGGEDNCVRIWCLRNRQCAYTISGHASCVSSLRFGNIDNHVTPTILMSASLDHTVKLWSHPVWTPLRELTEHTEKVMSADLSPNCKYLVSVSYDKQLKLWQFKQ